jgi:hypothetical protein
MTRHQRQIAVVVAIVVIGVVLGLAVSGFFWILIAGPIVVLVQYARQDGQRATDSTTPARA